MLICSKGFSKYLAVWMFRRLNFNKTSHLDRFEKEGNENVGRGGQLIVARPPRPRLARSLATGSCDTRYNSQKKHNYGKL